MIGMNDGRPVFEVKYAFDRGDEVELTERLGIRRVIVGLMLGKGPFILTDVDPKNSWDANEQTVMVARKGQENLVWGWFGWGKGNPIRFPARLFLP